MIVNMLKNLNRRYSNHYIIKFIDLISIHAINMNIVSSFIVFSNLYIGSIHSLNQ